MTVRVPKRRLAHRTKPGYRAGNSDRGDRWAKDHGYPWKDDDVQMTKDRVAINEHWALLWRDWFARNGSRLRWSDLTWEQARRRTSRDGYRVRTIFRALTKAHELGLRKELEAKTYLTTDEWLAIAHHAQSLWGDDWREHVNVKCLTTRKGWQQILHAAHAAGFPTIASCRGRWCTRRIDKPWITYTRGNVRTPKEKVTMSTGIYLEDHPPARSQFRVGRRAKPTGLVEVHTAESVMDTVGVDTGAEAVAAFIARRAEPGSYHRLVDSDTVVPLVRLGNEAYGDGTGTNPYAVHLSFANKTTDWVKMSPARRKALLRQGAKAAVEIITWLEREHGVTVPLRRIKKADAVKGVPGFMAHGDSDPGRRTDPGVVPPNLFPWEEFFAAIRELLEPDRSETPNITAFREAKTRKERREIAKRIVAGRAAAAAKKAAQAWLDADAAMSRAHRALVAEEIR